MDSYVWGEFARMEKEVGVSPVLALPDDKEDFVIYNDASHKGLDRVLIQHRRVSVYAFRQLNE